MKKLLIIILLFWAFSIDANAQQPYSTSYLYGNAFQRMMAQWSLIIPYKDTGALNTDSPRAGGMTMRPSDNKLYIYNGTSWAAVSSGGTITSITADTGITATPNPITSNGTLKAKLSTGVSGGQAAYGGINAGEQLILVGSTTVLTGNTVVAPIKFTNNTLNGSSVAQVYTFIQPTINQTSTAGYEMLKLSAIETGTGSGTKYLLSAYAGASGTTLEFSVSNVGNAVANNFISGSTNVVSAGATTTLTVASTRSQILTGTLNQTFQLPDATTLSAGQQFQFNNNSTGVLTVIDGSSGAICTIPAGGAAQVSAISVGTTAGSWDTRYVIPSNGSYGTAGLTVTGFVAGEKDNIVTTPTSSIVAINTTAATSGVPVQYSPSMEMKGTVWNGSASVVVGFREYTIPVAGASTTGSLLWDYGKAGVYTNSMQLTSTGALSLPLSVTVGAASSATGTMLFKGTTSGTVTLSVADAAGTYTLKMPTTIGTSGYAMTTDGVNQTTWTNLSALYSQLPVYNYQSGTTYTLQASDLGKTVTFDNGSAITLTVPSGLGADFYCTVQQTGAGAVTAVGSGATLNNAHGFTKSNGQWSNYSILFTNTLNTYCTQGDMQ